MDDPSTNVEPPAGTPLQEAQARVADLTRQLERQDHLKRVLRGIRDVNQLIINETDPRRLVQHTCDCFTGALGYYNAWVALLDEDGRVWATASSGFDGDFTALRQELESGVFPSCMRTALQRNGIVVVEDPRAQCPDCPASCEYGGRAGLSHQVCHNGRTWGVLTVSVPAGHASDEEEQSLFCEVAGDLGFALAKINDDARVRWDEQRLACVVEGAGLGTWEWNVQTNETVFNERWAGMLGRTLEELEASEYAAWAALVHPDDLARAEAALQRCIDGETPGYSCEFRMRHKGGNWVWIMDQGRIMAHDEQGKPLLMHGTHSDITRLKEAEEAARSREKYLETILNTCADGYWVVDDNLRLLDVNDAYCRMSGHTREELLKLKITDLDPGEDPAHAADRIARIKRDGHLTFTREHRRKDGTCFPVEISASWLEADGDRLVCFFRDLTERRRHEEQIVLQGRMLDQAPIGMMVHDMSGRFLYVNGEAARMHGHDSEEQLLAINLHELDVPESEHLIAERMRHIREHGEALFEVEHFRKDESRFPVEVYCRLIDWHGEPAILSTATDISERKAAEQAAREADLLLQEAVQSANVGLWRWDLRTQTVWFSDEWRRQIGHEPGDIPNDFEEWRIRVHPDDIGPTLAALDRRINERSQHHSILFRFRHKDGSWRWILAQASVHCDPEGKPLRMLGSHLDITDSKRAEEDLRFASHTLGQLSIGVYWVDQAGRFIYLNDAACSNLGYSREELLALDISAIDPDCTPSFWAEHWERMKRDPVVTLQCVHRRKDGTLFPVEIHGFFVTFEGREHICGLATDITERIRAEEDLRESEARFATAFRSSPAPLVLSEIDTGVFIDVNDRWVEMLETPREEQIGRASKDVGIVEYPAERDRLVTQLRAEGRVRDEPIDFRAKSGRLIPTLWSAEIVQVGGRDVMLSMVTDLTAIRQAEAEQALLAEQLNQAQKLESVGRLAGGVAHDFNNMLNVILGNSEFLKEAIPADHPTHAYVEEIQSAGKRSADLTRQLLAFARKQIATPRVLDLNEVVASMLRMVQRLIGEHIVLEWKPSRQVPSVHIDPAQVDQVLANLCVNARDAIGPSGGRILIETGVTQVSPADAAAHEGVQPGRFALLSISDDGCGISPEVRAHLFEPFFTTKGVGEGTGLGLATVYGIVTQNRGFIEVQSNPAGGSTFRIGFPEHRPAQSQTRATEASAPAPAPCGQGTILLAEDEPAILRMTSTMLTHLGYTVLAAGTPAEALELAESADGQLDLLITDVVMPGMNGRDLAARLLDTWPALKCLFISGYTADVIANQGVLESDVEFLQKPFTMRELGEKLREVLEE